MNWLRSIMPAFRPNGAAPEVPEFTPPVKKPNGMEHPRVAVRDAEVKARYQAGESSVVLANEFGISRERICQILRRDNLIEMRHERKKIAQQVVDEAREKEKLDAKARLNKAAEMVVAGSSIHRAAAANTVPVQALQEYCKQANIKSTHGRWIEREERKRRLRELHVAGYSLGGALAEIGAAEGKNISYGWAHHHCPELLWTNARPRRSTKEKIPVARPDVGPSFWTGERVVELRKHWKAGLSVQHIVDLLGPPVTRNAVIGKINRLRAEGQLFVETAQMSEAAT